MVSQEPWPGNLFHLRFDKSVSADAP